MTKWIFSSFGSNCLALLILVATPATLFSTIATRPSGTVLGKLVPPAPIPVSSGATTSADLVAKSTGTPAVGKSAAVPLPGASGSHTPRVEGRLAVILSCTLLQQGMDRLAKVPDYTARFQKQERVDGKDLQELQNIDMHIRHSPFSVYMKWTNEDPGQELLFVEGERDGKMLVKKGGKLGKLVPTVELLPSSRLARSESRHPVTTAGLLGLAQTLLKYRRADLDLKEGVHSVMLPPEKVDGRDCYLFQTEYASEEIQETYRKSLVWIDQELMLPIQVKNFCWPNEETERIKEELDPDSNIDPTLIEFYAFTNIQFETRLATNVFDENNASYRFRR